MDTNLVVFLLIFSIGSIMYIIFPDEVKNFKKSIRTFSGAVQ